MFAGSVTGGIPGSGTDRSATGPATGQLAAGCGDGGDVTASRAGSAVRCGARAGAALSRPAATRKATVTTAARATTATASPASQRRRLAGGSADRCVPLVALLTAAPLPAPGNTSHQLASISVRVTGRSRRAARPRRMTGRAVTVPGCPRCMLMIDPDWTAPSTLATTASGPGSVKSRESTSYDTQVW